MRYFLFFFFVFLASFLLSEQRILDEVMSKEDQKKTGVSYLTPNQKIALEAWINKNCSCTNKDNKNIPTSEKQSLFLSINIDNGQKLQLTDNSIWEVDPQDYQIAEAWLASIPIKITESYDTDYPFLLVNINTGVSVKARKASVKSPSSLERQPPIPPTPAPRSMPSTPSSVPNPPAS